MPSALVTGGSSGIGLAIARMLREEGYTLTLASRRLERLEAAASELGATAVAVDVQSEEGCAALVAAHLEEHGGLDVLVNSAGVGIAGAAFGNSAASTQTGSKTSRCSALSARMPRENPGRHGRAAYGSASRRPCAPRANACPMKSPGNASYNSNSTGSGARCANMRTAAALG